MTKSLLSKAEKLQPDRKSFIAFRKVIGIKTISSSDAPSAVGGYSQAVEISNFDRVLFVSGQIPEDARGSIPKDFRPQCQLVWKNIEAQLQAAKMSLDNVVKITIFLSARRYAKENREVRQAVLGSRAPAMTVIIADVFDEEWLLEIEAIAAA